MRAYICKRIFKKYLIGFRKLHITDRNAIPLLRLQEEYVPNTSTMHSKPINTPRFDLSTNVNYKSLHIGQDMNKADLTHEMSQNNDATLPPAYMNTGSDGNESLKYYVLEDASRCQPNM